MDKIICTVSRSKWARGNKNGYGCLLNKEGNMCCLGFLGETCGVSKEQLLGRLMPQGLTLPDLQKYPGNDIYSIDWDRFANVNDDPSITDEVREGILKELAEANGFTFVFED